MEINALPKLTKSLDENISMFKKLFNKDNTFIVREIQSNHIGGFRCAILFFDGMVNNNIINEAIIEPIKLFRPEIPVKMNIETLLTQVIEVNEAKIETLTENMLHAFVYGDSLILMDGDDRGILGNTKGFQIRSISEPENEKVLQGPREGFIESFMTNLSMIRRKLRTEHLRFQFIKLGSTTHTTASLCYIDGLVDKKVLKKLEKRLAKFSLDSALDSNYVIETIRDHRFSPFPTVGITERPDVVAAKLLEGRVALVVDGSPVVMTMPHIFLENFQANDDYYLNFFYTNITRMLRVVAFFLTISLPALYLSLVVYHQEIIPSKLLLSIATAREGVPFPSVLEAIGLLIIFEILKEAGTRTPSSIGQTLSIVGGLVLGQSAVEARLVSAPVVIVIAFAGITALAVPKLKTASVVFRLLLLLLSSFFGLYGYIFGISMIFAHLCAIQSFGIDYLSNILGGHQKSKEDVFLRFPWFLMQKNHRFLAGKKRSSR